MESTVCMTCGKVLGHLYDEYDRQTKIVNSDDSYFLTDVDHREIFKTLGIKRWCCKPYFISRYSITHTLFPISNGIGK